VYWLALYLDNKPFLVIALAIAFVALVLAFESFRGLRYGSRLFFAPEAFATLGKPVAADQEKQSNSISRYRSEGTRNSEVV